MNGDHTWQRLIRVSLISVLVCVALGAGAQLMLAQPRQPANKSRRAASEDVPSLLHEAALLLQAGKLDEAEPLLRRAIAAAPSNADAHNLLGVILDQRGDIAQAEQEYRIALRLNPNGVSATANLG